MEITFYVSCSVFDNKYQLLNFIRWRLYWFSAGLTTVIACWLGHMPTWFSSSSRFKILQAKLIFRIRRYDHIMCLSASICCECLSESTSNLASWPSKPVTAVHQVPVIVRRPCRWRTQSTGAQAGLFQPFDSTDPSLAHYGNYQLPAPTHGKTSRLRRRFQSRHSCSAVDTRTYSFDIWHTHSSDL